MGQLANAGASLPLLPHELDITPQVYIRLPDGDYLEMPSVTAFERIEDAAGGDSRITISFAPAANPALTALQNLFHQDADTPVDVRMEFMMGMLMVMSFSGFVEQISSDSAVFSVSSPMTTDVYDVAH